MFESRRKMILEEIKQNVDFQEPVVTGAKLASGQTVLFINGNEKDFYRAVKMTGRLGRLCNKAANRIKKLEDQLRKISELHSQLFNEEDTTSS